MEQLINQYPKLKPIAHNIAKKVDRLAMRNLTAALRIKGRTALISHTLAEREPLEGQEAVYYNRLIEFVNKDDLYEAQVAFSKLLSEGCDAATAFWVVTGE